MKITPQRHRELPSSAHPISYAVLQRQRNRRVSLTGELGRQHVSSIS